MISIRAGLFDYLSTRSSVISIVGNRVFPNVAPTKAKLPYIVYEQISGVAPRHNGGGSALFMATFQFDAYAKTSPDGELALESLRNNLLGFQGFMGNVGVQSVGMETEADFPESPDDGSQKITFHERVDYTIWYVRPIPNFI